MKGLACEPIRLKPSYKDYLWGGSKLRTDYGKVDAPEICAESWELSANPDGQSITEDGRTVNDLRAFWGTDCKPEFPILVKLIDARDKLSIQVHPSDETAIEGEHGKAEMWYVVEAEPQAYLYFGFSREISKEEFVSKARDGTICDVLNRVPVKKGDVFSILPGTVHAIGAGIVIAEIQQNSNTTFRIFDYLRKDKNGNFRELKLDRARDVCNFSVSVPSECRATGCMSFPEFTMTEMFVGKHFKAYKLDVVTDANLSTDNRSFQHFLCVEGSGVIRAQGKEYSIQKGDSYFIPAQLGEYQISGKLRILISGV